MACNNRQDDIVDCEKNPEKCYDSTLVPGIPDNKDNPNFMTIIKNSNI